MTKLIYDEKKNLSKKLAILIPNFNGQLFIIKTLGLLFEAFPNIDIVVVDDASTDDSIKLLEESNVKLLKRISNGGFAAAVNTGLKFLQKEGVDFVLVCNSDLSPSKDQGNNVLESLYCNINHRLGVIGFIENEKFKNINRPTSDISGFLFWIKLEILDQTGFMDERFYMYGEETDFFRRIASAGFDIIQSNVVVSHLTEMSATSKIRNSWYAIRNSIFLEVKNKHYFAAVGKIGVLLLVMWRIRGDENDASTLRVRRPGVLVGPILLLCAMVWNVFYIILPNRQGES